jgi:hypothetical protein
VRVACSIAVFYGIGYVQVRSFIQHIGKCVSLAMLFYATHILLCLAGYFFFSLLAIKIILTVCLLKSHDRLPGDPVQAFRDPSLDAKHCLNRTQLWYAFNGPHPPKSMNNFLDTAL